MHFVPAVAYYFCLALPAAFTQPWDHLLAEPCTSHADIASAFALERWRHEKQQSQHRLSFMNKQHFTRVHSPSLVRTVFVTVTTMRDAGRGKKTFKSGNAQMNVALDWGPREVFLSRLDHSWLTSFYWTEKKVLGSKLFTIRKYQYGLLQLVSCCDVSNDVQGSDKSWGIGCVNSLPGSAWL